MPWARIGRCETSGCYRSVDCLASFYLCDPSLFLRENGESGFCLLLGKLTDGSVSTAFVRRVCDQLTLLNQGPRFNVQTVFKRGV